MYKPCSKNKCVFKIMFCLWPWVEVGDGNTEESVLKSKIFSPLLSTNPLLMGSGSKQIFTKQNEERSSPPK